MRLIDLTGRRFNRLLVLSKSSEIKGKHIRWVCLCDCGVEKIIGGLNLRAGKTQSCGCYHRERAIEANTTHGMRRTPIYLSWREAIKRCKNKNSEKFPRYAGRGIKVCEAWQTFEGFYEDMGPSWFEGGTIERINNDGNYESSNCKWITLGEQTKNRSISVFLDTPWGRLNAADVSRKIGISHAALHIRMKRWPKERWLEPNHIYPVSPR